MTRTALAFQKYSSGVITETETTIDSTLVTAGVSLTAATGVKSGCIRVKNTYAGTKTMTISAGDFPNKILGDYTISFAQNAIKYINIEDISSRCLKFDGTMEIDFQTGFTGTISAVGEGGNFGA